MMNGYNITGYLNKIEAPYTVDTAETSVFGSNNKSFIPGMKDATLSAEGLFDGDVDAVDQLFNSALAGANTANNLIWFPQGNTVGNIGYGLSMIQTAYNVMGTKDDAVKISMAGHSNIGRERLKMIKALAAVSANGSSASQDNAAATTNGGSAYLQVTAASGYTGNVAIKLEHSTDNAIWSNLAAFTNVTGRTNERIVIAGTINRYVRATYTLNNGTATFAVALCRK